MKYQPRWDSERFRKGIFNPQLAESIATKTRHRRTGDFDDLRQQVEQSAASNEVYLLSRNNALKTPGAPMQGLYNQEEAQATTDSLSIQHYGSLPFRKVLEQAQHWKPTHHNVGDIERGDAALAEQRTNAPLLEMDRHSSVDAEFQQEMTVEGRSHRLRGGGALNSQYMPRDQDPEFMMEL